MHLGRRSWDWSWAALGVCAVLAALTVAGELRRPLNPDAAWLLYAAGRVLGGERLYTDILEINPPLIVWLNLPVAWVSRVTGLSDAAVFRVAVLALAAASCAVCAALAGMAAGVSGADPAPRRRWTAAAVGFVLLPLVGGMFGQREHLLLALVLPLVALAALRIEGIGVGSARAAAVGLAGGLGLALKPHYGVAWLLLVGYRWWAGGSPARRVLPEDVAVVGVGLAYPLLVLLLTPGYFPLVAGAARDYLHYGSRPLSYVLLGDSPALWFYLAFGVWLVLDGGPGRTSLSGALAVTGLGALVAIAAQHKGWSYHYLPLTACALLLALSTLRSAPEGAGRSGLRIAYGVIVALFAATIGGLVVRRAFGPLDPRERRQVAVRDAVRGETGARTILVLSSQLRDAFPLANDTRLRWVGGYPNMWMSLVYYPVERAADRPAYHAPAAMPPGERAAFQRTVRDLVQGRPDLLVVESPELNGRRTGAPIGFDFVHYFGQDSSCAAALARYRRTADVDSLWVLRREGT